MRARVAPGRAALAAGVALAGAAVLAQEREKLSHIHLWRVPAAVHGVWCSAGASLVVTQRFQRFSATLTSTASGTGNAAPAAVVDGVVDVHSLRGDAALPALLELEGPRLRLRDMGSGGAMHAGKLFERSDRGACRSA